MSGFYRGAVGDWFQDAITVIFAELAPPKQVEETPEPTGRVNVYETVAEADSALVHRMSMIPCGCCDCPGCYDCTPGPDEPCSCLPDDGIALGDEGYLAAGVVPA